MMEDTTCAEDVETNNIINNNANNNMYSSNIYVGEDFKGDMPIVLIIWTKEVRYVIVIP